jgi:hypothetical protein
MFVNAAFQHGALETRAGHPTGCPWIQFHEQFLG